MEGTIFSDFGSFSVSHFATSSGVEFGSDFGTVKSASCSLFEPTSATLTNDAPGEVKGELVASGGG